ncbi:MAG: ABC transporter permease [Bifidobacteriaceae bacterium]|jgi:putative ABC transport system permease protein|nr:ABC transporter permease [Bifidobacteriaceae bacterium]
MKISQKFQFKLKMIIGSILRRRTRMFIALLAIAVGSAILSGLTTINYDIPRQMGQEFRSYGANLILVPANNADFISSSELEQITKTLPLADTIGVAPYQYQNITINEQPYLLARTDLEAAQKVSPFWLVQGEWPSQREQALIGQTIADTINLKVGDKFVVKTIGQTDSTMDFQVAGILQTGGVEEEFVIVGLSSLETTPQYNVVECSIGLPLTQLETLNNLINQSDSNFQSEIVKQVAQSEQTVLSKLQSLIWLVSIIVLLLTMICVATTMMAVVVERRQEIGLKKSLGASNAEVVNEFLSEGMFLGIVGGIIGAGLGYWFADLISWQVFQRQVFFHWWIIPLAVIISMVVTVLACLIPVRATTNVDPALVLKGE